MAEIEYCFCVLTTAAAHDGRHVTPRAGMRPVSLFPGSPRTDPPPPPPPQGAAVGGKGHVTWPAHVYITVSVYVAVRESDVSHVIIVIATSASARRDGHFVFKGSCAFAYSNAAFCRSRRLETLDTLASKTLGTPETMEVQRDAGVGEPQAPETLERHADEDGTEAGATLVHFSAQLARFVWNRGCASGLGSPC